MIPTGKRFHVSLAFVLFSASFHLLLPMAGATAPFNNGTMAAAPSVIRTRLKEALLWTAELLWCFVAQWLAFSPHNQVVLVEIT